MRGVIAEKIAGTAARENSMTKKKQKKPVSAEHANPTEKPAERKPSKKERKAAAEQQKKELKSKRQKFYGAAMVLALIAVIISFASGSAYGQEIYRWLQVGCYVLMGCCGVLIMQAGRYEETEKRQNRMNSMGMVFLMVALGMGLAELVMMLRG